MDRATYCHPNTWRAFEFELGLEYRSTADDQVLVRAVEKLWHHPRLTGPWPSREAYGNSVHITPDMLPRDGMLSLYGLLELPDGRQAACNAWVVRPADASDSLSFGLPGGMLERLFPVAYNPMSVKRNPWLGEIERLLAGIAEWVYGAAPFELAVLGECASALAVDAADLTREALGPGGFILPDELWRRLERIAGRAGRRARRDPPMPSYVPNFTAYGRTCSKHEGDLRVERTIRIRQQPSRSCGTGRNRSR